MYLSKKLSIIVVLSLPVIGDDFNSKVINDYNQISAAYFYSPATVIGMDSSGHGYAFSVSTEGPREIARKYNISPVLSLNAYHLFGSAAGYSGETWSVGPSLGIAFRFLENRLNIVPKVALGFGQTSVHRVDVEDETHFLSGGLLGSYGINEKLGISAEYTYRTGISGGPFFSIADVHQIMAGPTYALTEKFGVFAKVRIIVPEGGIPDSKAEVGAVAGIEFHW